MGGGEEDAEGRSARGVKGREGKGGRELREPLLNERRGEEGVTSAPMR